jgi:microcystin-dependent protein
MSDYSKLTDFAAKDALSPGNPSKIVKGTEIDDELTAIAGAIASKSDISSPTFTGTPAAPTATTGTNTTQLATTAFANAAAAVVSPSGEIKMWPTATAPSGFLLCNGAAVSRTIYAALFAVIGTTFGSGDGTTTFTLPDLKNKFAVGAGDLYSLAATGGSKDAVVVEHTHGSGNTGSTTLSGSFTTASQAGFSVSGVFSDGGSYSGNGGDPNTNHTVNFSAPHTHTIATEGVSGTNANLPPYLALYFIIKT